MIKTDDIDEYASLMAIKSYCYKSQEDCKGCDMDAICSCMPTSPCNLEIKLELKKEELKKRQDIDITKQIQEKISDKLVDEKYDHMTSNEIAQSIMKNSLKKQ